MANRKQKWQPGDLFAVPNVDSKLSLGQIVAFDPSAPLGSVTVALFDERVVDLIEAQRFEPNLSKVIAVVFTTHDLLDLGKWKVIGHRSNFIPPSMLPFEQLRQSGFVGARVFGSRIIVEFLDAFHALRPWDDWHDPNYLDGLLISMDKKPKALIYVNRNVSKGR